MRLVDEYRVGIREISFEDLRTLVEAWSELNRGETPAELTLNLMARLK